MKKFIFLVMMIGMIISQSGFSQTYTIPYGLGIDTLYVHAGDPIIKPLVFYEEGDQLMREESVNGIIPMSSHGFTFFVDHPRFMEDTLEGTLTIVSGTFVNDPRVLAVRDDRTGGDMREPPIEKKSDTEIPVWPIPLTSGVVILVFLFIARRKGWA